MINEMIIDTDPGVDDAITILTAIASMPEDIANLWIVAVHGNVPLEQTYKNVRALIAIGGNSAVRGFKGAAQPLERDAISAANIHGDDGMHGLPIPRELASESSINGRDAILTKVHCAKTPPTILTLGSLTNIAQAYMIDPSIAQKVDSLAIMGGAFDVDGMGFRKAGNISPTAEFNVFADPDAAAIVFAAFPKIVLYPLNLTHQVLVTPEYRDRLRAFAHPLGGDLARMLDSYAAQYGTFKELGVPPNTSPLHDANTLVGLLRPDLYTSSVRGRVMVDTAGDIMGRTTFKPDAQGNIRVITGGDSAAILDFVATRLENLTKRLPAPQP